jgi:hypothetical protein
MAKWLEARIPVKGKVFIRFEGSDEELEIAEFSQDVPIRIETSEGGTVPTIHFEHTI